MLENSNGVNFIRNSSDEGSERFGPQAPSPIQPLDLEERARLWNSPSPMPPLWLAVTPLPTRVLASEDANPADEQQGGMWRSAAAEARLRDSCVARTRSSSRSGSRRLAELPSTETQGARSQEGLVSQSTERVSRSPEGGHSMASGVSAERSLVSAERSRVSVLTGPSANSGRWSAVSGPNGESAVVNMAALRVGRGGRLNEAEVQRRMRAWDAAAAAGGHAEAPLLERRRSASEQGAGRGHNLSKSHSLEAEGRRPRKMLLKARSLEGSMPLRGEGHAERRSAVSEEWLEQSVQSSAASRERGRRRGEGSGGRRGRGAGEEAAWKALKRRTLLERSVSLKGVGQSLKGLVGADTRSVKVMKERHWKRELPPIEPPGKVATPQSQSQPRTPVATVGADESVRSGVGEEEGAGVGPGLRGAPSEGSGKGKRGRNRASITFEIEQVADRDSGGGAEDGRSSGAVTRTNSEGQPSFTTGGKGVRFPAVRRFSDVLSANESFEGVPSSTSRRSSVMLNSVRNIRALTKTKFSVGRRASTVGGQKTYAFMEEDADEEEEEGGPRPLLSRLCKWAGLHCSITLATLFLLISSVQIIAILAVTAAYGISAIYADTNFVHQRSGEAVLHVKNLLHRELMEASISQIREAIHSLPKCAEETAEKVRTGELDWDDDQAMERHLYSQILHYDTVYTFIGKRSGEAMMSYRVNGADPADRPTLLMATNSYNEPPWSLDPAITDGTLLAFAQDEEGNPRNLSQRSVFVGEYAARQRPWYNVTRHAQVPTWIGPYLWIPDLVLGIDICVPIYDEASGLPRIDPNFDRNPYPMWTPSAESLRGVACCDTTLDWLSRLLSEQNLGVSGRAFVVEMTADNQGYLVAAAKKGELFPISSQIIGGLENVKDGSDTSNVRYERLRAVASGDPVISGVSQYILSHRDHKSWMEVGTMSMMMQPSDLVAMGLDVSLMSEVVIATDVLSGNVEGFPVSENGTWAKHNYRADGLNWLLVVAIQSKDFTAEIDQSRMDAQEATAAHVRDEGLLTIAIFLAAALTAVAASSSISRPLNVLSHKMRLLRNLQYAESFETDSWVREIRALQRYMLRLRENVRVFDKFVPHTVVERMKSEAGGSIQTSGTLWSEQRQCTVVQSTVKGLSALSEVVPLETMLDLLEDYMTICTSVIEASGGVVVDNQGDGVLAFWTDRLPDHAGAACEAVLEQIEQLNELFTEWSTAWSSHVRLMPMFGLHTADGFVGNFGTAKRLKYGVVGEVVEVAAKVNAMNRNNRTTFLISESTWEAVHGRYLRKYVGTVPVRSGAQSNNVYEVLGRTSWNPKMDLEHLPREGGEIVQVVVQDQKELNTNARFRYLVAFMSLAGLTAWSVALVVRGDGGMKVVATVFLVIISMFIIWAMVLGGASRLFGRRGARGAWRRRPRAASEAYTNETIVQNGESFASFGGLGPATSSHTVNLQQPYRSLGSHTRSLRRPHEEQDPAAADSPTNTRTALRRPERRSSSEGFVMRGGPDRHPSSSAPLVRARRESELESTSFLARLGSRWSKDWVGGNAAVERLQGWGQRLRAKANIRTQSSALTPERSLRRRTSSMTSRSGSADTLLTMKEDMEEEGQCLVRPSVWWVVMTVGLVVIVVATGLNTLVHLPRYFDTMELVRSVSENATRSMSAKYIQELHRKVFWNLVFAMNELNKCAHETRVQFVDGELDMQDLPRLDRHFFGQVLRYGITWAYMGLKSAEGNDGFVGASRIDYEDPMHHPDIDLTSNLYNAPPNNISRHTDTSTLIFDFTRDGYPFLPSHRMGVRGYNLRKRPWFMQAEREGAATMVQPYLWVGEPYHLELGIDACAPWEDGADTLVSCCAMSMFDVSSMLSAQALGPTGVAFVVESSGQVPGALVAAAISGETLPVSAGSTRTLAVDSEAQVIAAISRHLLSQYGSWAAVPDGYLVATDVPMVHTRRRAGKAQSRPATGEGWRRAEGMHSEHEHDEHNVLGQMEEMFDEEEWTGQPLQVIVQNYDGTLPQLRVDQRGWWQPGPYKAAGIELKLVIALTEVDAHDLSEAYEESRQQQRMHVTYYVLLCVLTAVCSAFLSHAAATEVSLPMQHLELALAKVTELEFDKTRDVETFVKDVQRIQAGFNTMHRCMSTFDKFVPSSVISRVMSRNYAERAMAGCPWMRMTQCTVVHCRIWGFSQVTQSVDLNVALEMMERYMRVCSDIIKNYRGVVSDFMGVQMVSFWQLEHGYAGTSAKELACEAVLRQAEEVQKLIARWRKDGVPGSHQLHFAAGVYSGRTYVGNFGTPNRLKFGVASETAAVAARLCNLTEIYSTNHRRPDILASGGTLCDDAVIETGYGDEVASAASTSKPAPKRASLSAPPTDRARKFKEGGGWFGASTKLFRGSQVGVQSVKPALVQLNRQFRWRKVDVINHFSRESGDDATTSNLKMEVYELLGSQAKESRTATASPTLDSASDLPNPRRSLDIRADATPRITGDLGTLSNGKWQGTGLRPTVMNVSASSPVIKPRSAARRISQLKDGFGALVPGASSGSEQSHRSGHVAGRGNRDVSIGLGAIDWSGAHS